MTEACKNFFSSVGSIINELRVPIIYAQEGLQVECNDEMSETELERYWSSVKGRAIARECNKFYSQCLAQCLARCWKYLMI